MDIESMWNLILAMISQIIPSTANYILNESVGGDCRNRKYKTKEEVEVAKK